MPIAVESIMPCLWFDTEAEDAANHYVSIFTNSKLGKITRYGKEGKEIHGKLAGSVLTVEFEIDGHASFSLSTAARSSSSTRRCRSKSCCETPGGRRLLLEQASRKAARKASAAG